MSYKHGVYGYEVPTSIVPPVRTSAALSVVFGTAPVHLAINPAPANKPILCYSYAEAVDQFGYSDDWDKYTLCEFVKSQFALYSVAPIVLINVLDKDVHKTEEINKTYPIESKAVLIDEPIILETLKIKTSPEGETLALNVDYMVAFDSNEKVKISLLAGVKIEDSVTNLLCSFSKINAEAVTSDDIVGGVDAQTGEYTGLELVNQIFPYFRLVPGLLVAPKWSTNVEVAAVMTAKAGNINGHFKCLALLDIPTDGDMGVKKYSDVANYKNLNNIMSERQIACWPLLKLGDDTYHMSSQLAGLLNKTDASNEDIPYASPSNKSFQANGAVLADGKEIMLAPDIGAYLNGQGVLTALNFIGGWKCFGNRTAIYPSVTDPKDSFIPLRRMFDWINNTLILTYWQKLDFPITKRMVETIVDSVNIWLNGLTSRQFILGGRIEFRSDENPNTDIMDGIIKFHVYVTPPSPAREFDFILEYDPIYLENLFA